MTPSPVRSRSQVPLQAGGGYSNSMRSGRAHLMFDVIEFSFPDGAERLLRSVASRDEADRLVDQLTRTRVGSSTFFCWVTRRG